MNDALMNVDASICEREPIHIPGAIQPHGAVLAVRADSLLVTHASANLRAILGHEAASVLGRNWQAVFGEAACHDLLLGSELRSGPTLGRVRAFAGLDGRRLNLHAHRTGAHICVDIKPARPEGGQKSSIAMAHSVLETFRYASGRDELCELAVRGLKLITGYDRVMAYHFHEDGHGEVIAEAREAHLEPYLGFHYPAGDVPAQSRQLILRQRVGAVADTSYQPVPLLADAELDDGTPLDLTHSVLRSVSAVHREYMRNLKIAASLTVGLTSWLGPDQQKLWGILVCHHATPRVATRELLMVGDMIGEVMSLLLASLEQAEIATQRLARVDVLHRLVDQLAAPLLLPEALVAAEAELLHLVDATGALVRHSGTYFYLGRTPPPHEAERALSLLHNEAGGEVLAVDNLGLRHPELAGCIDEGSGALLLPFPQDEGDAILWFRPELSRTLTWGGNPAEHITWDPVEGRVSPRASFAAWKETMRGRSAPWMEANLILVRELRIVIEAEAARRTKADLDRVRHHDTLTGLPNQLALEIRMAACRADTGDGGTLLFINLDGCKAVNDTMGYAAGDVLLVEVARRLLAAAGPEHFVARFGGEQFVVLFRGLEPDVITALGHQLKNAIEAPIAVAGSSCRLSAHIGAPVLDDAGGINVIQAADMASFAANATLATKQRAERQRQKMESVGRMMGGVAHEINNMLQPVSLLTQDVVDKGLVAPEGKQHLDVALDGIRQARQIIGDLLAFSRPTPRFVEVLDSVELLHSSLRLVRQAVPPTLIFCVQISGCPPCVAINRTTFVQILLNLVTNGAAAMDHQGKLLILLDEDEYGPGDIGMPGPTNYARLKVIDAGSGMNQTTLDRAFEPFFTTKPVGQGTGLGLSVVYGMVQDMGGTITLASEMGQGTTATIWIPGRNGENENGIHTGD